MVENKGLPASVAGGGSCSAGGVPIVSLPLGLGLAAGGIGKTACVAVGAVSRGGVALPRLRRAVEEPPRPLRGPSTWLDRNGLTIGCGAAGPSMIFLLFEGGKSSTGPESRSTFIPSVSNLVT